MNIKPLAKLTRFLVVLLKVNIGLLIIAVAAGIYGCAEYSTFSKCGGSMWIGLTDRDKVFSFRWTSGEPVTYTNWEVEQPDNGTGAVDFYVHIWPPGSRSPGKWNDYLNADNVFGIPLYGVAELPSGATLRLSLRPSSSTVASVGEVVNAAATAPELHVYTAIELSWSSEGNRLYQVQWTPSLDNPQWVNLEPAVAGKAPRCRSSIRRESTGGDFTG